MWGLWALPSEMDALRKKDMGDVLVAQVSVNYGSGILLAWSKGITECTNESEKCGWKDSKISYKCLFMEYLGK